jgi:uncharacterized membrane protein YeaQ/YmgE (transglycosylase-associated protein family)
MIASAHVAAGIVVGIASTRIAGHPTLRAAIAFVCAMVVHLLMDALPHSDYGSLAGPHLLVLTLAEGAVVCGIAAYLLHGRVQPGWIGPVAAGLVGSALPDAKFIVPLLLPSFFAQFVTNVGNRLHTPFHSNADWPIPGLAVEVLCTVLLLASLRLLAEREGLPSLQRKGSIR